MIGCAAMIGIVAFVIGLIAAVIANDPTFPHPLIVGAMTGGMTFVAALILVARDRGRHTSTIRNVRQVLLARQDINDGDYLAHFPDANSTLVAQTRQAVSDFFDVPVQKIHPTDSLRDDLQFDIQPPVSTLTPARSRYETTNSQEVPSFSSFYTMWLSCRTNTDSGNSFFPAFDTTDAGITDSFSATATVTVQSSMTDAVEPRLNRPFRRSLCRRQMSDLRLMSHRIRHGGPLPWI